MIGGILNRLLGRSPAAVARPPTRLDDDQAIIIASRTIALSGIGVLGVANESHGTIWTVGTQNIGVNEWVRIADATGEILEHRREGLR